MSAEFSLNSNEGEDSFAFTFSKESPIPGTTVVSSMEIHRGILLTIVRSASGHYEIYRSYDSIHNELVHCHSSEIYKIVQIDMGVAIFSASDGWWLTIDDGTMWYQISDTHPARSFVVIRPMMENDIILYAYCDDRKIYTGEFSLALNLFTWEDPACVTSGGIPAAPISRFSDFVEWHELYDTGEIGLWYPAMDGSAIALLVGAGNRLLRYEKSTWKVVQVVDGIISHISISDQMQIPVFMITIEKPSGSNDFRWTYDIGDSLVQDINRVFPHMHSEGVIPTGDSETESLFVFSGKRHPSDINREIVILKNRSDER